jgi:hypothetical protein
MSSKTSAIFPIVSALATARDFGKAETDWQPGGPGREEQLRYFPLLKSLGAQTGKFSEEELKSIASDDVDAINSWLKEAGFDIKLSPFEDVNDFGVASIMSVLVSWKTPGVEVTLTHNGKEHDAARVDGDVYFLKSEDSEHGVRYEHHIACIICENGDKVYMTVADESELTGLDLLEKLHGLSTNGRPCYDYEAVVFPQVLLDQEVDISFFEKMWFAGTGAAGAKGTLRVKEAKQQTKFKMNHKGAKAESAAAFGMAFECCMMPKPDLTIDKPFYVWMTRDGLDRPYFAGYIDTSDWKNPGEIK